MSTYRVTERPATLISFKRQRAIFALSAPNDAGDVFVERMVPAAVLRTNLHTDPRRLLPIKGTPYRIAVPAWVGDTFMLGHLTFYVCGEWVECDDPIPASWLVNLDTE